MMLARFTCNFKCDKVRVIVAWGKNCREESDKVFAIGYQVVKEFVLTVIQLTYGHCLFSRSKVVVTDCNTEHAQTGYKIVINCTHGL